MPSILLEQVLFLVFITIIIIFSYDSSYFLKTLMSVLITVGMFATVIMIENSSLLPFCYLFLVYVSAILVLFVCLLNIVSDHDFGLVAERGGFYVGGYRLAIWFSYTGVLLYLTNGFTGADGVYYDLEAPLIVEVGYGVDWTFLGPAGLFVMVAVFVIWHIIKT
jgi:hypothetical protein